MGLEEKEVDSYFKEFINISKKDMVQETKSGTLRIDIEKIDEELLFWMKKIIKSFIKKRKFYQSIDEDGIRVFGSTLKIN